MSEVSPQPVAPRQGEAHSRSPWSFRLLTVAGIPIRINIFFILLLVYVAVASGPNRVAWTLLVVAVFACVLLHELGHALAGRRFGIITKDITLYPFGGIAMLENRPRAIQEFWIALAGPAVNFVLALIFGATLLVTGHKLPAFTGSLEGNSFVGALFIANLSLGLFNLVPAFPMDGGRVLRAVLASRMADTKATQIAAVVGQGLAIALGFFGLMTANPILIFVAFFVFFGAGQEVSSTVARSFLEGHTVQDAMERRFRAINSGATLEAAGRQLLEGSQKDFPVLAGDEGEVLGILLRDDIAHGLANDGPDAYVAACMHRDFRTAKPDMPLDSAVDLFGSGDATPILVMDQDRLVGMMTQENLSEFIVLAHARSQRRPSS